MRTHPLSPSPTWSPRERSPRWWKSVGQLARQPLADLDTFPSRATKSSSFIAPFLLLKIGLNRSIPRHQVAFSGCRPKVQIHGLRFSEGHPPTLLAAVLTRSDELSIRGSVVPYKLASALAMYQDCSSHKYTPYTSHLRLCAIRLSEGWWRSRDKPLPFLDLLFHPLK